jgi:hypothetical protein
MSDRQAAKYTYVSPHRDAPLHTLSRLSAFALTTKLNASARGSSVATRLTTGTLVRRRRSRDACQCCKSHNITREFTVFPHGNFEASTWSQ